MRIRHNKTLLMSGMLLILCALCAGCGPRTIEQHPPVDNSRLFIASLDEIWTKLLEIITTGEETLTFVDKAGGLITFQKNIPVKQLAQYAFDDSGMLMSQATANVVLRVAAQDEQSTRVLLNTKITATGKDVLDVLLSRQRQVVLDSKGWLEREYFDRLNSKLQKAAAPQGAF